MIFRSRLLKKPNIRSQCRSLRGFQTLLFIYDHFSSKLWLKPIMSSGSCFQAVLRHLKWPCYHCSIGIWADFLFSDMSSIRCSAALYTAQDLIQNMLICSFTLFLLRDYWMIDWEIEQSMSVALVCNKFSRNPSKFTKHQNIYDSQTKQVLQDW